ncbi:SGNH/GDSL hydrolase family protein [Tistrella mobilis]|uniref:autotransporter domain-containing protein n=1 Tax=Tistrella mobilis TaxID=171437 RepID=UPI00355844F3
MPASSLPAAAGLLSLFLAGPALAGSFVFGDSSVEQGNLYVLPGFDRTGAPYYAPDGFSRESNGPVWIEHLVPGIAPSAGATAGSREVNFAFSGATSGDDNIAGPVTGTGFGAQIDAFAGRGLRGRPGDLFVVAIGTNDFIRDLGSRDLTETSAEVIGNIGAGLDRLADLGARRILVEDVPDFYLAPAFAGLVPPEDRERFNLIMHGVLDRHRADQLAALRDQSARPGAPDIVTVRVSRLFDHVLAHAAALGFTNVTEACYDEASGSLCSTDHAVQNTYLFFDGLHLTEAGQRLQADYYRALLSQLAGTAHALPQSMTRFARTTGDQIAARARDERFAAWADAAPAPGFSVSADGGAGRDDAGLAALGLGWSDGLGWTVRLDVARHDGKLVDSPGSTDVGGWSVVASGERRLGRFRLGVSLGTLTARAKGFRTMPVALMRADHKADIDSRFAEISAGYVVTAGALTLQPAVWLRWSDSRIGAFTEHGRTGLEMAFDEVSTSGLLGGAGLHLRYVATGWLTPWASLAWEDRLSGFDGDIRGRLVDNPAKDITRPLARPEGTGELRAGVDIGLGPNATLRLAAGATTERDRSAHARVAWRF